MTFVRIFVFVLLRSTSAPKPPRSKTSPGTADAYTDEFSGPSMPIIVWS
jgi:hypothetical protein